MGKGGIKMTRNDIVTRVNKLDVVKDSVLAEVYFILKKSTDYEVVFADIENDAQKEIADSYLDSFNKIVSDEDQTIINLSMADSRIKTIYLYDLSESNDLLLKIKTPLSLKNPLRKFNFKNDKFDEIFGFIIKIGIEDDYFTVFKKNYPISLLKKDSFSLMRIFIDNTERLSKVKDDILKLNFSIDFFIIDDNLYIKNINVLEKFFDFKEIIKKEAMKSLGVIEKTELIDDIELMRTNIDNISFSRKLVKTTSSSNVLNIVSREKIIEYSKTNACYKGRFKYNMAGNKFLLDTKISQQFFLKLIDDEILKSELTEIYYDSKAKDKITVPGADGDDK
jgi:hypothetical protein